MGCVYAAISKKNLKVYVGKTVKSLRHRRWQHGHDALRRVTRFGAAIKRYGLDGFWWVVIHQSNDPIELAVVECFYIDLWKSNTRQNGFNLTAGGDGMTGHKQSAETRKKRSETLLSLKLTRSTETRMRMSHGRRGIKPSPETIEKVRASRAGYRPSHETRRKQSESMLMTLENGGGHAKVTARDIPEIRKLLSLGVSGVDVAKIFGVHQTTISCIQCGRTWRHIPVDQQSAA